MACLLLYPRFVVVEKKISFTFKIFAGIAVLLLILRLALPFVLLNLINQELAGDLNHYEGHLEDLSLSLWRGAYTLNDLTIKKKDSNLPPLLNVKKTDVAIAWQALLRKEISMHIVIDQLHLQLLDSQKNEQKQLGNDEPGSWVQTLNHLIPMHVESLKMTDSTFNFNNNDLSKSYPIALTDVSVRVDDLRSNRNVNGAATSPYWASARLPGNSGVQAKGKINILSSPLNFSVALKVVGFPLASINKLLMTYVPLDFSKGILSLYTEFNQVSGNGRGYAKIFVKDVTVIASQQKYVSVKHFSYEMGAAFGNWVLRNSKTKDVAVMLPMSWSKDKFNINGSDAFWSAVKNKWNEIPEGFDPMFAKNNSSDKNRDDH